MSARRLLVPLVAGVLAAVVAFAVATALTDDDDGGGGPARSQGSVSAPSTTTAAGAAVFARMGCGSCHALAAAGSTGEFGPSLDQRLAAHSAASLRAAIVAPPRNSMMPADFGVRMSKAELDALVAFLLAAR